MLSSVTGARPVPSIHGLSSWKKTCSAAAVPACLVRAARSAQLHGVCGENSKQGEVTASGRPFSGGEHRTS